jgi:23S rRNA (guanosine2251-2'-O)-methyltransferase
LVNLLKSEKFKIYCIDKKAPANSKARVSDIFDMEFSDRLVFIIGGEKRGISKDFLNNADEIVRIPYAKKFPHSLAAQTAATIVAYEIHRQRNTGVL